MRNQYKRDINRLVQHPRRRPGSRQLRNPGGFASVYSQGLGLTRTPGKVPAGITFRPARLDFSSASWPNYGAVRTDYGAPYQGESGGEINYPLGTEGASSSWVGTPSGGSLSITRGEDTNYGSGNWIGKDGSILSWLAPPGRVYDDVNGGNGLDWFYSLKYHWGPDEYIYYKGNPINHGIQWVSIIGAAFYTDSSGQEWLWAASNGHEIFRVPLNEDRTPSGEPELVAEYANPTGAKAITGWYFSASGDKAVCTFKTDSGYPQQIIVARFDGSSITDEVVYDQSDVLGQSSNRAWGTMEITEIDQYSDYIDYAEGTEDVRNLPGYNIPVYYDFNGDTEIEVRLEVGQEQRNVVYSIDGFKDESTSEEQFSESYTVAYSVSAKLATSEGKVLANFPDQVRNLTEAGSYSTPDGWNPVRTASSEEQRVEFTYFLKAVDGRFGCAAILALERTVNFSGSGEPGFGSYSPYIAGSGNEIYEEYLALYVNGEEKDRQDMYNYSYTLSQMDLQINLQPLSTRWQNYDTTTQEDVEKVSLEINQREIIDFMGYTESGLEFYSTTMLDQDARDGAHLFYRSGSGGLIDDALAQGSDVYLLEPGLR